MWSCGVVVQPYIRTGELLVAADGMEDEEAHVMLDHQRQDNVHRTKDEGQYQPNLTTRKQQCQRTFRFSGGGFYVYLLQGLGGWG